jgi:hypothetical protein
MDLQRGLDCPCRLTGNILLPALRAHCVCPKSLPAIWSGLSYVGRQRRPRSALLRQHGHAFAYNR